MSLIIDVSIIVGIVVAVFCLLGRVLIGKFRKSNLDNPDGKRVVLIPVPISQNRTNERPANEP